MKPRPSPSRRSGSPLLDRPRHRRGLARPGGAEQRLEPIGGVQAWAMVWIACGWSPVGL
jgi:hypothetical protein